MKTQTAEGPSSISSSNTEIESKISFDVAYKYSKIPKTEDGFSSDTATATHVVK